MENFVVSESENKECTRNVEVFENDSVFIGYMYINIF
jgi:hypothetical protein